MAVGKAPHISAAPRVGEIVVAARPVCRTNFHCPANRTLLLRMRGGTAVGIGCKERENV